tara:strand:- start:361 stop:603 length:243 start_codon:yes stop_codon:yes gene_type:complete
MTLWSDDSIEGGFAALRLAVLTSIEEQRKKEGLCPECGSEDHEGCLLAEGPLITAQEFLDHAAYLIAATLEIRRPSPPAS